MRHPLSVTEVGACPSTWSLDRVHSRYRGLHILRALVWAVLGLSMSTGIVVSAADAATFQTIHPFGNGSDGAYPYGKLVMDGAGILYGVTGAGGASTGGTVFSLDPASRDLITLYSFTNGADGGHPQTGLTLDAKGNLYGVTTTGGSAVNCIQGCGTVFRLNIASKKLRTLHTFTGLADGYMPEGALLLVGNTLYGTTNLGGTGANCGVTGCGTLFKFVLSAKIFTTVHELAVADGANPIARLVRAKSGLLYGTATSGGTIGSGTVFSFDPATNAFARLHSFDNQVDGSDADADLMIDGGFIYGTMGVGPTNAGYGTIYKLDPATGKVITLYSFKDKADGAYPGYGVVLGPSGRLYGTAPGGQFNAGVVFKFNRGTLAFKPIHQFATSDGSFPSGSLLYGGGALYGVTRSGGNGYGTAFKIIP